MDNTETLEAPKRLGPTTWLMAIAASAVVWVAAYAYLTEFADLLLGLTGLSRDTHLGEAVHFFLYDTPKVLLLLTGVVFLMGVIQTFFAPERTRALLAGRRLGIGNILAAHLGIVTPFCSCSAVPLFIGFLSAGVPMGVTFSFLIAAPMVNEVALVLLFGLFGWQVAGLYLVLGSGCRNCEITANVIAQAAKEAGVEIELEKVTDIARIMSFGVMSTPGVVVDGEVLHAGGVPGPDQARDWVR